MYHTKALCNSVRPGMFGADAATPPAALGVPGTTASPAPAPSFIPALAPSAGIAPSAAASSLEKQYQATTTPTPIHPGLTGSVDTFGNAHPVVAPAIRYAAPAGLAYWGWAAAHPVALGIGGVWLGLNVLGKIIQVAKS